MSRTDDYPFSDLLRGFRQRERMSQQRVATQLGVHRNTVFAWERGDYLPQTSTVVWELSRVLRLDADDTEVLLKASVGIPSVSLWAIPFRRNPFFTGRENLLLHLHETLHAWKAAALTQPQAICGLGGIGKTQTAIEYAYRHHDEYQTVFWIRADTQEILISDFLSIAKMLQVPQKDEHDQNRIIEALKKWLNDHTNWLMILDNIEDLTMLRQFLPPTYRGHILLTTRAHVTGTLAQSIHLDKMEPEEGALFLLRRVKLIAPDAFLEHATEEDCIHARNIAQMMDGLPLALDQASSYIEETGCSLSDYQNCYQSRRAMLLDWQSSMNVDHPSSVNATFSLSFERVEQTSPAAANLLRLCAFLHPDDIPEEIFTEGASALDSVLEPVVRDPFQLNLALVALRKYSLVRRHPDRKTLSLHRLVQAVLKERMDEETQTRWAERTVQAVNTAFPESDQAVQWPRCHYFLSHAQICAILIQQHQMISLDAGQLLYKAGTYLRELGLYAQAEEKLFQSHVLLNQILGATHPHVIETLATLALLYYNQGKYSESEQLYQRVLQLQEQCLEPKLIDMAGIFNNMAVLYGDQSRYSEAESLCQRALEICEQQQDPHLVNCLNSLAMLYLKQDKHSKAEPLLQQALSIYEQQEGLGTYYIATLLNDLALLYFKQSRYSEAEPLYQRALEIYEQQLGLEHPYTASTLNNLATLYLNQGRYAESQPLFVRALRIREKALGLDHLSVAGTLNNFARLYSEQGKCDQAKQLLQQALIIREKVLGPEHPDTMETVKNYENVLRRMKRDEEAASRVFKNEY